LVGGVPQDAAAQHPGGQVSATLSFLHYCESIGCSVDTIDTSQVSFPVPSFYRRLAKSFGRLALLLKLLSTKKYLGSVIFSSAGFSVFEKAAMSLICRAFKVKSILFIRSGHFISQYESSRLFRIASKIVLQGPTYLGAQGDRWVDLYRTMGVSASRVKLVRNWVRNDSAIASTPRVAKTRSLSFIFVGWVVEKKGIKDLVMAFAGSTALKFCNLSVVGAGELLPSLESYCSENQIENITFYNWQEPKEVDRLLAASDVFVLPTYAEGFPNSLLEAMSFGLPAITTPVGGIPDTITDNVNGFLIEPGDIMELRLSMEKFVANPRLIEKFSEANLIRVREQHGLAANCNTLLSVFN
jgi:glycosyltransferase involved in cell wall biosynthesis